jgi:Ala-tRNA(Pro) deacylase
MTAPDPSAPAYALLDRLGIAYHTVEHPPVFTVQESQALRGTLPGGHTKNLFVKDKADRLFLITAEEDSPVDLNATSKVLGVKGRLSFCSAERLRAHLGVEPGSVTPLALVADQAGDVTFIIEKRLLDHAVINVHPLINSRTTALSREDLLAYIRATGHEPTAMELPYRTTSPAETEREPGLQDGAGGPT